MRHSINTKNDVYSTFDEKCRRNLCLRIKEQILNKYDKSLLDHYNRRLMFNRWRRLWEG